MAVSEPGDIVTASRSTTVGTTISKIIGDDGRLPTDPTRNTASIAAEIVRRLVAPNMGVSLLIEKGLPLSSGLGSSAASAVAAALAVNELFGSPLSLLELIPALLEAEAAVSGRHLDNVAPCLFGGIVLSAGVSSSDIYQLPVGKSILSGATFVLITPSKELPTVEARRVLPTSVPFRTMVKQSGAVARLIHAIYSDNLLDFARAMNDEQVVHVARSSLIDGYDAILDMCVRAGALSVIISGGGPTLMALCPDLNSSKTVVDYVCSLSFDLTTRIVKLSTRGAHVLSASTN